MFNLNNDDIRQLQEFVDEPNKHIESFVKTFEEAIANNGPDSFTPMVTMFRNPKSIEISIVCRDHSSKEDMYKAFAEMLHYFSASSSHSFIFAVDVRQKSYSNDNFKNKIKSSVEALTLAFVSENSSGLFVMPYTIQDKKVNWIVEDFDLSQVAEKDPSEVYQGDMAELLYIMTHMDDSLFTTAQLLNYYTYKKYMFIIPDDAKTSNIIKVEL